MREIKFRSWDEYSETMVFTDGSCGTDSTDFVWQVEIDSIRCYKIDLITENYSGECNQSFEVNTSDVLPVMQYTGLKDKNGVEIYEGDLLKIEMDWGYGLAEIIIKVYFENGSFRAKALNSHEDTFLLELPYLEVIGNIYENPELLRED